MGGHVDRCEAHLAQVDSLRPFRTPADLDDRQLMNEVSGPSGLLPGRHYTSQAVLKRGREACPIGRVPAGEIEGAVIDQLRAVFRQPEIVVGKINLAYMSGVLRLALLAPEVVEAILHGRQPEAITLPALMKPFPAEWKHQEGVRAKMEQAG